MTLDDLLTLLEYDQSPYYISTTTERNYDPGLAPLLRAAHRAGVHGIYVFLGYPDRPMLWAYAQQLVAELDDFTMVSGTRHRVLITRSPELVACTIQIIESDEPIPVRVEEGDLSLARLLADLQHLLKQRFTQWISIHRALRIFHEDSILICKPPRIIDWTRTQALNDADDIIAEILL